MAVKNLLRIRSRLLVAIRRSLEKPRKQATAILQATAKSYALPGDDSAWVKSATSQGHLGIELRHRQASGSQAAEDSFYGRYRHHYRDRRCAHELCMHEELLDMIPKSTGLRPEWRFYKIEFITLQTHHGRKH